MNQPQYAFQATNEEAELRLDHFLKAHLKDFSRSQIQRWIKRGSILCDGQITNASHRMWSGEQVTVTVPTEETSASPEAIPLNILFEDDSVLVINKPSGMVVHPSAGRYRGTLVNAVAHHLLKNKQKSKLQGLRPGIVHRLDKETSGVLVVGKTAKSTAYLSSQFKNREISKIYRTIVSGKMDVRRGEIEGPIGKDFRTRKMSVMESGRLSYTDFKVLKSSPRHTYLEVYPRTGRTHQIRVHLAKIGYPVAGDPVYGKEEDSIPRLLLHAYKITFRHPVRKKKMEFRAPIPKDFSDALKRFSLTK